MTEDSNQIDPTLDQAAAALQGGRPNDAERIVRDALTRAPDHRRALYLLGVALLACGRGAEAIAPFERLAQHGADAGLAANLAMALAQAGRLNDAIGWLQRATAEKPDFAVAFQKLGQLLQIVG